MSREIGCDEYAERFGVSRKTAYRHLCELERRYAHVAPEHRPVRRRGKRGVLVYDEERALALSLPSLPPLNRQEVRRIAELEARLVDAERRIDALARELSDLKRQRR